MVWRSWELGDVPLLKRVQARLNVGYHAQAATVEAVLNRNEWYKQLEEYFG